jgi:hypothetical protein
MDVFLAVTPSSPGHPRSPQRLANPLKENNNIGNGMFRKRNINDRLGGIRPHPQRLLQETSKRRQRQKDTTPYPGHPPYHALDILPPRLS